mgnify:CR=1 FL=1
MGSGVGGMIDILFLISGVYLIFTAVMAKKKGNIVSNVMLGKDMSENDIIDKSGFIAYMYKRILLAGIMIIAASIIHIVNDYYIYSAVLTWLGIGVILAAIGIYTASYRQGQKRYLRRQRNGKKRVSNRIIK